MQRDDFIGLLDGLVKAERDLNLSKGREYAQGDEDALGNFKQAGEFVQVRCPECGCVHKIGPLAAAMVYMFKHFTSLASYVHQEQEFSNEPISGRVEDMRLYCALFLALAKEAKTQLMAKKIQYSDGRERPACSD